MRKLSSLTLPEGTQWTDQFGYSPVQQVLKRTVGGGIILYNQALYKGRPITLEFEKNYAWLTYSDVQQIINWANVPAQSYIFQWDTEDYIVQFNHTDRPYEFLKIWNYETPDNDIYYGKINLITT